MYVCRFSCCGVVKPVHSTPRAGVAAGFCRLRLGGFSTLTSVGAQLRYIYPDATVWCWWVESSTHILFHLRISCGRFVPSPVTGLLNARTHRPSLTLGLYPQSFFLGAPPARRRGAGRRGERAERAGRRQGTVPGAADAQGSPVVRDAERGREAGVRLRGLLTGARLGWAGLH